MKPLRHIIALITAATLIAACRGESYPGIEYIQTLADDVINTESSSVFSGKLPVQVFINEQSFISAIATRGTGPMDVPLGVDENRTHYENAVFHIFAFRDTPDDQGPFTYEPQFTRRSDDTSDANANCLVDGWDYNYGMPSRPSLDHSGHLLMKKQNMVNDTTLFYNSTYQDIGYNFFAYYLNDVKINSTDRQNDHVSYEVEIDGTQDLMVGHAPTLSPATFDQRYGDIQVTPEQRNHVLNIRNYSGYAAALGINPEIDMQHALTRIRIMAYPMEESADNVMISSVEFGSCYNGTLTVAAHDQNAIGFYSHPERKLIPLMEFDPTTNGSKPLVPLNPENNALHWDSSFGLNEWEQQTPTHIGADIMLPSDTAYTMKVIYQQKSGEKTYAIAALYRITAPELEPSFNPVAGKYMFLPGRIYTIRIQVYGLQKIRIYVGDENGWEQGGEMEMLDDEALFVKRRQTP